MAEHLQEDVRQPDVSIDSGPPGLTTQPGIDLEVDVSYFHSQITTISPGLTCTSARYTRYRIYLGFFVSPILHFRGHPNLTNLTIKGLERLVT